MPPWVPDDSLLARASATFGHGRVARHSTVAQAFLPAHLVASHGHSRSESEPASAGRNACATPPCPETDRRHLESRLPERARVHARIFSPSPRIGHKPCILGLYARIDKPPPPPVRAPNHRPCRGSNIQKPQYIAQIEHFDGAMSLQQRREFRVLPGGRSANGRGEDRHGRYVALPQRHGDGLCPARSVAAHPIRRLRLGLGPRAVRLRRRPVRNDSGRYALQLHHSHLDRTCTR